MQNSLLLKLTSLQEELHILTAEEVKLDGATRAAERRNHDLCADIQLLSNRALPQWLSPPVPKEDAVGILTELQRALERVKKVRICLTGLQRPTTLLLQQHSRLKAARKTLSSTRNELEMFHRDHTSQIMVLRVHFILIVRVDHNFCSFWNTSKTAYLANTATPFRISLCEFTYSDSSIISTVLQSFVW